MTELRTFDETTPPEKKPLLVRDLPPSEPGRFERWAAKAQKKWENRPDLLEIHYIHLPIAVAVGAVAIGTLDQTLHTHIANRMARVKIEQSANPIERGFQKVVHELGTAAVDAEK